MDFPESIVARPVVAMRGRARTIVLAGLWLLAAVLQTSTAARATGAIAVGSSGDLAKDGFAFGGSINAPDKETAIQEALKTCRKFEDAPKMAKLCKIVGTFTKECYALAFDPKAGESGTGWAIAADKQTAEARAMAACRGTAGPGRAKFCSTNQVRCDGKD